ncbi:MAG: hypothetical protein SNG10_00380 [Rikenellaceae bacterium]
MKKLLFFALSCVAMCSCGGAAEYQPRLYASPGDQKAVAERIETQEWAKVSFAKIVDGLEPYVVRHQTDPEWIVSRLSMYWKEGEHYDQCYLLNQNWDYGEGNAPVPTPRFPGMRTWNKYYNVPLEDRTPYCESGDMWGTDRTNPGAEPVLVPYKESGHMVRANNGEIMTMARNAAYVYWVTKDEKYAKFAADIYYKWLSGVYYMNPIKDPTKSTGGYGGWEPGGICGYYDYEQIHDDLGRKVAGVYDYLYPYLMEHTDPHLDSIGKTTKEVNDEVMKRFIELGMIRGGKLGNWNVNGFACIMAPIMVLDSNDAYEDGKGKEYYLEYFLTKTTDHHACLIDILKYYDPVTGLWDESPGYSFGIIKTLLDFATMLLPHGVDIIAENAILQKAAVAIMPWMDARGNLVVFGDTRGGAADFTIFERLLTYFTITGDSDRANQMAEIIAKGIEDGTYSRDNSNWIGLTTQVPLAENLETSPVSDLSYSKHHRFFSMKDYNGANKMMATIYGGRKGKHLSANGLAITLYYDGYALAPDAAGYESYWSADFGYHQKPTGVNTIAPGYTQGDIVVNGMFPIIAEDEFVNPTPHDSFYRMVDVTADEKRRVLTMVRCSEDAGYYVDIFASDQNNNDYIFHNVGESLTLKSKDGKDLKVAAVSDLGTKYSDDYSYFTNQRKVKYTNDFIAHWDVAQGIQVDFRHLGAPGRELYVVDAPYSTLSQSLTPGGVSASPDLTPTLIIRQNGVNGKKSPFVGVYEPHKGAAVVKSVDRVSSQNGDITFTVTLCDGRVDTFVYTVADGLTVTRK